MTPDANPIVSEVRAVEGLYCCAGFAGHGFMHSPAIGALMAELILGRKPHLDISSYHIDRFDQKTQREQLVI
jgi:sarcosine oxidase subunit beta